MKPKAKYLLIAILTLSAATPVLAGRGHGPNNGRVVDRLERQHDRIEQGIESGELTRREARRLKRQQRKIRQLADVLYEDHGLSRRDRRLLREELDRASDRIYRLKHNDKRRHRGYPAYSYWIDDDLGWPRYGYVR